MVGFPGGSGGQRDDALRVYVSYIALEVQSNAQNEKQKESKVWAKKRV